MAHHGLQYADIGNTTNHRLSQRFTLTYPSRILVTWWDSVAAGYSTSYDVAIFREPSNEIAFYYDFGFAAGIGWTRDELSSTLPIWLREGEYRLEFIADETIADALIDSVSVESDRGPDANAWALTVRPGGGERFVLDALVTGAPPITKQWQMATVLGEYENLVENQMTPVGVVQGVNSDRLVIDRAVNGAQVYVRVLLNNVCRGSVSDFWGIYVSRCNTIDINRNGVYPEDQDVIDFFTILAGGECSTGDCVGIDFNGNGVYPEDQDVIDFFAVLAGSACPN